MTRKLAGENAYTTLVYSALVGTVGLSLALPWQFESGAPTLRDAAPFLLLGLFAGLGHWFVISAYLLAPASQLTPFAYLQMIWATLYGFVIFGQLPDHWSALGMADHRRQRALARAAGALARCAARCRPPPNCLTLCRTALWRAIQRVSGRHCSQSCSARERGRSNTVRPSRAQYT